MQFESVAANLRESFRVVAAHRSAGELQEMDGVSIASAGVTFQMFNAAFLSAPVVSEGQMDLRAAQAAVHFAARGQRWAYWICHGWLDGRTKRRLHPYCASAICYQAVELPGMLAEELLPPVRATSPHGAAAGVRRAGEGRILRHRLDVLQRAAGLVLRGFRQPGRLERFRRLCGIRRWRAGLHGGHRHRRRRGGRLQRGHHAGPPLRRVMARRSCATLSIRRAASTAFRGPSCSPPRRGSICINGWGTGR